jgi:hypothetical protein
VEDVESQLLRLASEKDIYYQGDFFSLRVFRTRPSEAPGSGEGCPVLYLRQRSPNGATRIDETSPLAFRGCPRPIVGYESGDWNSGFDLDSGANSQWGQIGENDFQVFGLAGSTDDHQLHFFFSNNLRIQLADPAKIQFDWGPESRGLAIGLSLDKGTYGFGEDIPLRVALKNFSADASIVSGELPCFAGLSFELRDSDGLKEKTGKMLCTGHGWIIRYPKGELVPVRGLTLKTMGLLPSQPGKYLLIATWFARSEMEEQPNSDVKARFGSRVIPYAVVQSISTQFAIRSAPQ